MSESEPLRLVVLLQGSSVNDQVGYHRAFEAMVEEGRLGSYDAVPYRGATTRREWESLLDRTIDIAADRRATAVLLQYFHVPLPIDPVPYIERIARLSSAPTLAASCGDGFGAIGAPMPQSLRSVAPHMSVVFSTAMGRLGRALERAGARRVVLVPHGACHVRFGVAPDFGVEPEFQIVFVGSRPRVRNAGRHLFWAGRRRTALIESIDRRYGSRFAVFGRNWDGLRSWQGPVPFEEQMSASSRGRIVLGGYPGSNCDFYMSDRPFIAALSGRALLDHRLGGVDTLFDDGREWALAAGVDETIKRIDQLLANGPESTRSMGMAGESAVRSRHMTTHRTDVMVRVLEECRAADLSGVLPRPPQFGYFHSGVDEKSIYPLVLRGGWSL